MILHDLAGPRARGGHAGRGAGQPAGRWRRAALLAAAVGPPCAAAGDPPDRLVPLRITGDAIEEPLTAVPGDAARGRAIVADRRVGLCLLCHGAPLPEQRFQGDLAPTLAGAGARSTPGQLRLRIVDARRLNPDTPMPSYYRVDGLTRVGAAWQGRPILNAQQVEDVVAYLSTLKDSR